LAGAGTGGSVAGVVGAETGGSVVPPEVGGAIVGPCLIGDLTGEDVGVLLSFMVGCLGA